ncbi:GntR family transcriptional regulator [Marinobacterium sedimentorum]|uniref:GntR family transcriptional regulator n=1 Tax=Marinobacterium sedimentorum TaxID=2927804 RepID=UPI0020C686E4|nr:GntR family transcriptional regulator [Marinobacterium sedimentorum]MCP8689508.1 GntR family transcriptional regulator [Marinobacterium sedimentorum]
MTTSKVEKIKRPKSLAEIVTDQLRTEIMEGNLELGKALSEIKLADKYGVSKTPVREAFFRLKQEGIVDIIPQKGSFVYYPTSEEVSQLCDFRAYIEPLAFRESYVYGNIEFLDQLEIVVTKMRRVLVREDYVEYLRLDSQFHQAFFDYCKNRHLKESYMLISAKVAALRSHMSMNKAKAEDSNSQHIQIVDLLNDKKIDEAVLLLKKHILDIKDAYVSCI